MPSHPLRVLLVDPGNSRGEINEPIGIATLAATLEANFGPRVVVEQRFVPFDGPLLPRELTRFDLVGLSTPLGSLAWTEGLVAAWRSLPTAARPLLVLGGLLATFAPEDLLDRCPGAVCVLGEGEKALCGLVAAVAAVGVGHAARHAALQPVPNLALDLGGQRVRTPRRNITLEQAVSPRRRHAARIARDGGIARAEASRGCAWGKCRFCAIQHKYCDEAHWRPVPVERVMDELAQLSDLGVRHPYFTDEDFVGTDPARSVAMALAIRAAKDEGRIAEDLSLYLDMRVSSLLAPALRGQPSGEQVLDALISAGLREVFVGVESGAKEQVKRYQKAATAGRNQRVLELLGNKGLSADVGFIMFDPEMSFQEIGANLAFLRGTGLWWHDSRLTKELRLEAGTPLVGDYRAKGLICGPMDLDELCYPYRWVDPRAEEVRDRFRAWEAEEQARVYALQSATRGEVRDPEERARLRSLLGRVRSAEHGVLETICESVARGAGAVPDLGRWGERRSRVLDRWDRSTRVQEVA
ncbi:MAG: cobalamin-dependent protein [Pseudomonadota bacterium]